MTQHLAPRRYRTVVAGKSSKQWSGFHENFKTHVTQMERDTGNAPKQLKSWIARAVNNSSQQKWTLIIMIWREEGMGVPLQ